MSDSLKAPGWGMWGRDRSRTGDWGYLAPESGGTFRHPWELSPVRYELYQVRTGLELEIQGRVLNWNSNYKSFHRAKGPMLRSKCARRPNVSMSLSIGRGRSQSQAFVGLVLGASFLSLG